MWYGGREEEVGPYVLEWQLAHGEGPDGHDVVMTLPHGAAWGLSLGQQGAGQLCPQEVLLGNNRKLKG
jgi:hypothetical protein